MEFSSVEQILDYAIEQEEEACRFYMNLSDMVERREISQVLKDFANEEKHHKEKLQGVKEGRRFLHINVEKVLDLKIAEYIKEEEPQSNLDYQQALILAMQREKNAFRMYTDLAKATDNAELKDLFLGLAQEEAKHKLRFEIEYEEHVLQDN